MATLFCFGMGYCAKALTVHLVRDGWRVVGTAREQIGVDSLRQHGFEAVLFEQSMQAIESLDGNLNILVCAPPKSHEDPVLSIFSEQLASVANRLNWVGYLSTTGVYGNRGGEWVDEATPISPKSDRAIARASAELGWLRWASHTGVPVKIFRLAGIYGPGRNQLETLLSGRARRIVKQGQMFSRIHVEDIAQVLAASLAQPDIGLIYNLCDDEPCPPQDVVEHAARLLNLPPPPAEDFDTASQTLSEMAKSFYSESKRVKNQRMKSELQIRLKYPTYREGLQALLIDRNRDQRAPTSNGSPRP